MSLHRPNRLPAFTALLGATLLMVLFAGSRAVAQADAGAYKLGPGDIEGLSVVEFGQLITQGLKDPDLVNPDATVSIGEYRPFCVHGEVERPGVFPYQPGLTIQKAVALAGGFTERAARSKIEVTRASDPTATAQPIELSGPVFPGDVITVQQSFF